MKNVKILFRNIILLYERNDEMQWRMSGEFFQISYVDQFKALKCTHFLVSR